MLQARIDLDPASFSEGFTAAGFEPAWQGQSSVRRTDRAALTSPETAALIRACLAEAHPQLEVNAISAYLRLYRYEVGHYFDWHVDLSQPLDGFESTHTCLICLEANYDGGVLVLSPLEGEDSRLVLEAGDVVIFDHDTLHKVEPVTRGRRLVLRTDLAL